MPVTTPAQPEPDNINETEEVVREQGEGLIVEVANVPFSIPQNISLVFPSLEDFKIISIPLVGAVGIRPVVNQGEDFGYMVLWNTLNPQEPSM